MFLDLRILKELWAHFLDLRILKGLRDKAAQTGRGRDRAGQNGCEVSITTHDTRERDYCQGNIYWSAIRTSAPKTLSAQGAERMGHP